MFNTIELIFNMAKQYDIFLDASQTTICTALFEEFIQLNNLRYFIEYFKRFQIYYFRNSCKSSKCGYSRRTYNSVVII